MLKFDLGGTGRSNIYKTVNLSGNPDVKSDILDLDSFCKDDSVDEFFMSHTYEHVSPVFIETFLKRIQKKLNKNGCLRILHTDIKECLELYKKEILDFKAIRDLIFAPLNRRVRIFKETGKDLMNHQYMWGKEELKEELEFYGFSKVEFFDAGSWKFDIENSLPKDNMLKFHGTRIPNLGVIAYK